MFDDDRNRSPRSGAGDDPMEDASAAGFVRFFYSNSWRENQSTRNSDKLPSPAMAPSPEFKCQPQGSVGSEG